MAKILSVAAEPYEFQFDPERSALLIIDMQRDFLEPGGFGEMLGNDVSPAQANDRAQPRPAQSLAGPRADGDPHPRGPSPGPFRPA